MKDYHYVSLVSKDEGEKSSKQPTFEQRHADSVKIAHSVDRQVRQNPVCVKAARPTSVTLPAGL